MMKSGGVVHSPDVIGRLLRHPVVGKAARRASDWVDLQFSWVVTSLERVAPQAHGRMLDVGCGDKPYERLFRPFVTEYIGIEHSSTFNATSAGTREGADLLYDGMRLPFPDKSFDTVMSIQVLEHTPRPAELIAEMSRVLRAQGLLILSAPFSFRLHEEPHDYFRFSPHGLRELCGRAGLEVTAIESHGSLWSLLGHKVNTYLALRVARIGDVAQAMGKLGHEAEAVSGTRTWTLPLVAPTMVGIALAGRVLDRAFPDPSEALGFTLLARHS